MTVVLLSVLSSFRRKPPLPSFRRKPESILTLPFRQRFALNERSSLSGFARHPWRASHFLCLPKESNQRNAPSRSRSRGHPCPRDYASRLRGSSAVRPCTVDELARILRATLRAFPAPARRDLEGTRGKAERGSPCRRRSGKSQERAEAKKKGAEAKKNRRPREGGDPVTSRVSARVRGLTPARLPSPSRQRP